MSEKAQQAVKDVNEAFDRFNRAVNRARGTCGLEITKMESDLALIKMREARMWFEASIVRDKA